MKTGTKTPRPATTLTDKSHLKVTALILEAHIACINSDNDFEQTLFQSLKLNFDIDVKVPDRDSKNTFNLYFDPPTTKHDVIYKLCPDTDNAFIDNDDIR